jgi:hypothetical protein
MQNKLIVLALLG